MMHSLTQVTYSYEKALLTCPLHCHERSLHPGPLVSLDRINEGGAVVGTGGYVDVTFYVWGYSYDVSPHIAVPI
jgi:hypothetical protein